MKIPKELKKKFEEDVLSEKYHKREKMKGGELKRGTRKV